MDIFEYRAPALASNPSIGFRTGEWILVDFRSRGSVDLRNFS